MRLFNFNGMMDQASPSKAVHPGSSSGATHPLRGGLTDGQGGGFHYSPSMKADGIGRPGWFGPPFAEIAGSYKLDCPEILPGQPVWLDWHYFYLTGGTLSGTGAYAGGEFTLGHQPANAFFGFQVGLGANNKNDGYGATVGSNGRDSWWWMARTWEPLPAATFVDLDCCLPWQVEHDYVAQDDCGNAIAFEYTVTNSGVVEAEEQACPEAPNTPLDPW